MIKEYFITNYLPKILNLKISNKYLILKIKSDIKVPKYYYIYLLKHVYNIYPHSVNMKCYNTYYKIIILKYLLS